MHTQGDLGVERMCELAGVSRASFYRWLEPQPEPPEEEVRIRDEMHKIALETRCYGYRRMTRELNRRRVLGDALVGAKRVRRLMAEDNLLAVRKRRFVATTDSQHSLRVYSNLAANIELNDVDQLWVSDLTYLQLAHQFVFLAVVLDGYSRRVVGWALGDRLDGRLALAALDRAVAERRPRPGLVHHSDRGTQYASHDYVGRLEELGALLSMSAAGRPWENGKCESFIKTLKTEEIRVRPYRSREELAWNVEDFIERYYNPLRLHSALGYRSPAAFENSRREGWQPAVLSFRRHQEIYPDV